jgi:hypothetical protein
MLNVGQPDTIGPVIAADGNRMGCSGGRRDRPAARARRLPRISAKVILVGRSVMPSIMYDGCLLALGNKPGRVSIPKAFVCYMGFRLQIHQ